MYIMTFYKLTIYYSDMPITLKISEIINTDNYVSYSFWLSDSDFTVTA
jgi:hypothetical protein